MALNYWSGVLQQRISRRRALVATGGVAGAAALLAACGGSSTKTTSTPKDTGSTSALVFKPEDTSKQAKRGGTVKFSYGGEPATLEPHGEDLINLNTLRAFAYSNLVIEKPGTLGPAQYNEFLPNLAESWEFSPDHLTLTMKIRQDIKFHPKAPINGRAMDVQDIVFSWNRYAKSGAFRSVYANAVNPEAPIVSIAAPDNKTIVIKSAFPAVDLLPLLAAPNSARYCIVPKETDSTFNPKGDMIGTGPFMLDKYTPSVGMTWKRHPEYHDKDRPYVDQLDMPFLADYGTALAQFQAGNIWTYVLRPADMLQQKQQTPALLLAEQLPMTFGGGTLRFGWQGKSPFNDERVRQAVSYAMDRNLFIDTFYEAQRFEGAGIPLKRYWASAAYPGYGPWWLNPQSKDFGANAKFYDFNLAEAKKLMAAAGIGSGVDVKAYRVQQPVYGPDHFRQVAVINEMMKEIGIRTTEVSQDYAGEYVPKTREGHGNYEGLGHTLAPSPANDAVSAFVSKYYSKGGTDFLGYDANGKGNNAGDPKVDSDIEKARREFDVEKRRSVYFDIQRYLAQKQYGLSYPGVAQGFFIAWPVLRNFQHEQGDAGRSGSNTGGGKEGAFDWWIDDTQAPLKK